MVAILRFSLAKPIRLPPIRRPQNMSSDNPIPCCLIPGNPGDSLEWEGRKGGSGAGEPDRRILFVMDGQCLVGKECENADLLCFGGLAEGKLRDSLSGRDATFGNRTAAKQQRRRRHRPRLSPEQSLHDFQALFNSYSSSFSTSDRPSIFISLSRSCISGCTRAAQVRPPPALTSSHRSRSSTKP